LATDQKGCYTTMMNVDSPLARRAALAITLALSACATVSPGSASGSSAAATAYGSFLAARYADAAQDSAAATHYYGLALQADPDNQNLIDEGFIAAILAGSPAAQPLAREVTGNAIAIMLLGNQDALHGDYDAAQQQYLLLPHDSLSGLLQPLLIAWAKAGAGDPAGALAGLIPAASRSPFGAVYILNAALIADQANDMKDAVALYNAAAQGDQAPNLRMAQIMASWDARQGQPAAARAILEQMAATHPTLAGALPNLEANMAAPVIGNATDGLAEAYLSVAGALNQPSQTLLQVTFLRFALSLRPDLAAARLLLANVQAGGGNPDPQAAPPTTAQMQQALATLSPIPDTDPLYAPAALQEATLMAGLGETANAVKLLSGLAAKQPGNIDALETAGDIFRDNNQFSSAIAYYDKAIAILPQPVPPAAWSLYYDRGICADQNGDWKAAEPDLQTALTLSPNQPYVLNYLGYTWALRGENLPKAQAMLQQAAGLDPNEGAIIDSLGYVNLRQGYTQAAMKLLTQAVEMDPDDAEVNAHLGDAFYAAGLKLQADYQWQRALALKPDPKLQAQIETKLKQVAPPA
jgi:tetratricopeptide (TPR) repeat protein